MYEDRFELLEEHFRILRERFNQSHESGERVVLLEEMRSMLVEMEHLREVVARRTFAPKSGPDSTPS